ncbi:MAG: DNA ligase-associated DEXH box helicase, partial [Chloroflexota bacterium]
EPDPTTTPFEPVRCHTFVTECTFGLPIYRWPAEGEVRDSIARWWVQNAEAGRASLLMGYALGKSQRALAGLDAGTGPIVLHGAVHRLTEEYRRVGVAFPPTTRVSDHERGFDYSRALILAPPSAAGTTWLRRFSDVSTAFMSGWMAIRGARRRRAVDRGFVLSDHVDWPSLLDTIATVGAERVYATHGYVDVVVRHLREIGVDAHVLPTVWEGERDDGGEEVREETKEETE